MFKIVKNIYILMNILVTDADTDIHTEHFFTKYKRKKEVTHDNIFFTHYSVNNHFYINC